MNNAVMSELSHQKRKITDVCANVEASVNRPYISLQELGRLTFKTAIRKDAFADDFIHIHQDREPVRLRTGEIRKPRRPCCRNDRTSAANFKI